MIKLYSLTDEDYELIKKARDIIRINYDQKNYNHTVGSALLGKSGRIYAGINLYSLHGACAEQVAIGSAVARGKESLKRSSRFAEKKAKKLFRRAGIADRYYATTCLNVK